MEWILNENRYHYKRVHMHLHDCLIAQQETKKGIHVDALFRGAKPA